MSKRDDIGSRMSEKFKGQATLGRAALLALMAVIWPLNALAYFGLNFLPNTTVTDTTGDANGYQGGRHLSSCFFTGYGYQDNGCIWDKSILTAGVKTKKFGIADQMEYRYEAVTVSGYTGADAALNGTWFHLVLGGRDSEWKQDTYVKMGGSQTYTQGGDLATKSSPSGTPAGSLSDSGGFTGATVGSNNNFTGIMDAFNTDACALYAGNGCDPIGLYNSDGNGNAVGITNHRDPRWNGNGSGNPTRVIMRQVDKSATGAYQEFLKDRIDHKPLIYQSVNDPVEGYSAIFQVDMRNRTYSDTTALTIGQNPVVPHDRELALNKSTNARTSGNSTLDGKAFNYSYDPNSEIVMKQWFTDPLRAPDAHYDAFERASVPGNHVHMTASQYSYTPGAGWVAPAAGLDTYYSAFYNRQFYTGGAIGTVKNTNGGTYSNNTWYKDGGGNYIPIYQPGTYAYVEGGFDQLGQAPWSLADPAQNICMASPFCP
ncbi:MAG: hypothetical protein HY272_11235 [Gammaproteobacteria bacterium]|nr:hypothetical protein [Gammaproteobacteria bacterium]